MVNFLFSLLWGCWYFSWPISHNIGCLDTATRMSLHILLCYGLRLQLCQSALTKIELQTIWVREFALLPEANVSFAPSLTLNDVIRRQKFTNVNFAPVWPCLKSERSNDDLIDIRTKWFIYAKLCYILLTVLEQFLLLRNWLNGSWVRPGGPDWNSDWVDCCDIL